MDFGESSSSESEEEHCHTHVEKKKKVVNPETASSSQEQSPETTNLVPELELIVNHETQTEVEPNVDSGVTVEDVPSTEVVEEKTPE